jgi:hypothetical protein
MPPLLGSFQPLVGVLRVHPFGGGGINGPADHNKQVWVGTPQ